MHVVTVVLIPVATIQNSTCPCWHLRLAGPDTPNQHPSHQNHVTWRIRPHLGQNSDEAPDCGPFTTVQMSLPWFFQ